MESSSPIASFLHRHWPLLLILFIAAFSRFYRIADYMEFLGDQGRDIVIVRDFLKNGNFFFIGPQTSIGNMYLGPYYYYLIAPALFLANYSPVGPAIFVALLGVATVFLVYLVARLWFDSKTALIAALLYALSPVVIKYSNFSWNPNIMPFFALLFVYFLQQKKYPLASLAFVMVINSHYLGLLLLPLALFILAQNRPSKASLRPLILATLIFIVSLLPQVLFDLKHQGQNLNSITTFFTQRETTVSIKPYKAIPKLFPLHTQIITSLLAAKNSQLGLFLSLLLIAGSLLVIKKPKVSILLIWYLIALVGLGLYKQHIYDHYFGFLFPCIFLLFSVTIVRLKYLGYPILAITLFSFVLNSPLKHPVFQLKSDYQVVDSIRLRSNNQPFNFALLAKQNYDPPYRYLMSLENLPIYQIKDRLTDQLFVVCEPFQIDCNPINHPEWGIAAFGWAAVDQQWQIGDKIVYRLVHTQP